MSFDFNDHADEAARKDNIIQRLLKRETELTERAQDWRYKYEQLLARHTELVEAVKWERECEDVAHWRYEVWVMAEVGSGDCEIYTVAQCIRDEARAEVDRLIGEVMCAD